MAKSKTFYVTTAIDYTNAEPHIGHAYQKVIADFFARYKKSLGYDVFFLTGTDEHGAKIQRAAEAQGKTPKEFVDILSKKFEQNWKSLDVDFNRFMRTTDGDHEEAVQLFTKILIENGDIYKGEYEGLYCVGCEAYVTEKDLVDGCCQIHKKPVEKLKEESYFFKLSKYQKKLLDLYEKHPEFIQPVSRRNEIINRVKEGLKDLCIARKQISWGIPFPSDESFCTYVWYEALQNYITGVGWPEGENFKKYWPADLHLLGKDNSWFHNVIWPALLLSAKIKLPKTVFVHGFLTVNGQKISKSLGNTISPSILSQKYGSDAIRYYLMREIPFGEDGDFSEHALVTRINSDLADALGNLLSRTLTLVEKFSDGKVPKGKTKSELGTIFEVVMKNTDDYINKYELHHALEEIWSFIDLTNKYVNEQAPWTLSKENRKEELNNCLYNLCAALRGICALTYPIIPEAADEIATQLGIVEVPTLEKFKWQDMIPGTIVRKGNILFKKYEDVIVEKLEQKPKDEFEKFRRADLRVAKIEEVSEIPGADKLYKLKISLGQMGERQIVAGVRQHYAPDELEGKKIIIVANLKPAKLRGELSQGMLLAGVQDENNVGLLTVEKANPGDQVSAEGIKPEPAKELDYKDFAEIKLVVQSEIVSHGNKKLMVGSEKVKAENIESGFVR